MNSKHGKQSWLNTIVSFKIVTYWSHCHEFSNTRKLKKIKEKTNNVFVANTGNCEQFDKKYKGVNNFQINKKQEILYFFTQVTSQS